MIKIIKIKLTMRSKDIKNEIRKRITKDQLGIFKTEIYKDMHKEINYFLGEIFDDNMKIKDAIIGQTVTQTDILQMYVWIPRYKYTIFNGNNGGIAAQEINITFESGTASTGTVSCTDSVAGSGTSSETCTDTTNGSVTNGTSTYTHPSFSFGTSSLTGFWVGKFETSNVTNCTAVNNAVGAACDLTTLGIQIKPNVTGWRGASVSTFFTSIKNIATQYSKYTITIHFETLSLYLNIAIIQIKFAN